MADLGVFDRGSVDKVSINGMKKSKMLTINEVHNNFNLTQ